jgi:2-polyprenyl-3-methyl-5-hydroxy-6-metoxy-1,4-benzoquinol methylase
MTATTPTPPVLDEDRLNALLGQAVVEFGATVNAALVVIGDQLGLYRELAAAGPLTSSELAQRTGTAERYVREWLNAQAASGWVDYDHAAQRYAMSPEQAMMFADPQSPAFVGGGFQLALGAAASREHIAEAFATGTGFGWGEHDHDVFDGCQRFFEPGYHANVVQSWIPALDGIHERLLAGGRVADVGCGHGASSIIIAQAYPDVTVDGSDLHGGSIDEARRLAAEAGVGDRVTFSVAAADALPAGGYDLVTSFDCLHDMGDPAGVARHVRAALAPGGAWMIVEPRAGDSVPENLNPVGRAYYAFSTLLCTPSSLSQEGGLALGAQAGEARLREVLESAGFASVRRATETPFNLVLEARP